MFHLHESTQRRACRIAFVVVCLVPTVALVTFALWRMTPLYRQAAAADVSQTTGTSVTFAQLLHPRPGVTRLKDVVLAHPETGETLAQIRELQITRERGEVLLHASQPKIFAGEIDTLWRQCQRQLLDESFPAAKKIELTVSDVTFAGQESPGQTLSTLQAIFTIEDAQRRIHATYEIAGVTTETPATIEIVQRDGRLARFHWNTGGQELPIAPWTAQTPWLARLGKHCCFRGKLTVESGLHGLSGEIVGTLSHVDLDRLVSQTCPHKLSGQATLNVNSAKFAEGRLVEFRGRLIAGPGVIGDSLLKGAEHHWQLIRDEQRAKIPPEDDLHRYRALALDFAIDTAALTVHGACDNAPEETLLIFNNDSSVKSDAEQSFNPATLVRILSKQKGADVPATQTTRALIRWLPLAEEMRSQETNKPPQAHLRGGPT